jgi:hypothetical protein
VKVVQSGIKEGELDSGLELAPALLADLLLERVLPPPTHRAKYNQGKCPGLIPRTVNHTQDHGDHNQGRSKRKLAKVSTEL